MINEQELNISNKSYVNKDFQKLYPEILEVAKQLSSKWDPSTSNESDPGVVLLKLLAFVGDKINYNIDKNILEAFMPSATQESTMRNLCEINGYYPKYYRSATVDISFMYTGSRLPEGQSFKLNALETTVTDVDGQTTYTLLNDCTIFSRYTTVKSPAIEGKLESLTVNNNTQIHLANLDDNNRIYFPEKMVAENGIFVQKVSDTASYWSKVDNLNTTEPGQLVYKFGYDSIKGLPYLEFPSDIANLIEEGLYIKYIRTTGSSGNVKTGFLTRLSSPAQIFVENDSTITIYPDTNDNESEKGVLIISNQMDSNNGSDPESINEAYNSFKKVVGTFDTLVTSRDYANAIYNSKTADSKDIVSNIQVTDRRTDINYSNQILSFNKYGPVKVNTTNNDDITAFDICLYPLNPIITSYNLTTYLNSFLPLSDKTDIFTNIDEYKTISHDFKELQESDVYLYKNYYKLNVKISTTYKVNTFEQESILKNINESLYKNFNSRELDYGYEIPFDTLLQAIQNADPRIKNVSLEEPELYTKVMTKDKTETLLIDNANKDYYLNLVTKNILAGRASLFEYSNDFDFEFGQTTVPLQTVGSPTDTDFVHEQIVKLTTEVTIPNASVTGVNGYTLKENEYIQAIAPSLATEITYPAYVNYRWSGDNVPAGEEHMITGDEYLIVNYTDSNTNSIAIKYTADKVITYKVAKDKKSGMDYYVATDVTNVTTTENIFKPVGVTLKTPAESGAVTSKKIKVGVDVLPFYSFGTEESVEKRKFVKTTLTSKLLPCYWIMKNTDNALFTGSYDATLGGYQTVLGENEYFIYSNGSLTELEVLGSGTRLTLKCSSTEDLNKWKIVASTTEEKVDIASISEKGLAAFESYNWKYKNFDSTYNLTLEEMSILTMTTGDNLRISTTTDGLTSFGDITNTWVEVSNAWEISYTIDGETKVLPTYNNYGWKLRSRLDLNSGPDLKQRILTNQVITMYLSNGLGGTKTRIFNASNANVNSYIIFNTLLQQAGGVDLDMQVTYLDGTTAYDVTAYTFDYTELTYTETDGKIVNIDRKPSGYCQINCANLQTTAGVAEIELPIVSYYDSGSRVSADGATELLMIYWDHSAEATTTIKLLSDAVGIKKYNTAAALSQEVVLSPGINVIEINSVFTLTLEITNPETGTDVIQLGKISVTTGYNQALNLTVSDIEGADGVFDIISTLDANNIFYYNGSLDSHSLIEFNDLSDPRALFDYNNLANRFTLCQLDFENSKIEIVRTSRI